MRVSLRCRKGLMPLQPINTDGAPSFEGTLRNCLAAEARQRQLAPEQAIGAGQDQALLRSVFGNQAPLALLAFDTPGLQDYVFRVRRPIDIRGGSQQVRAFTDGDAGAPTELSACLQALGLTQRHVIYAGAGQGLLVLPEHVAPRAQGEIERLLAEQTSHDLRPVAAWLPVWPWDLTQQAPLACPTGLAQALGYDVAPSRYAATRAALATALSRRRSQRTRLATAIPAARQDERCDACELHLGAPQKDGTRVCAACTARRRCGGSERRDQDEARTFEDVVKHTGHTALAVIYVDGANFGSLFRGVRSMAQHKGLSDAVTQAFAQAAKQARGLSRQALVGHATSDIDDDLRFQTPLCGGDDLVLILPAVIAPTVVEVLLDSLEAGLDPTRNAALRSAWPQDAGAAPVAPGVGVGLAIADTHVPVHFLLGYAKDLMRSAKVALRANNERSAVDFMVLTSGVPLGGSLQATRGKYLRRAAQGSEPALNLTERPYTGTRFRDFLRYARALDGAMQRGRAQVFAVRQEVMRGYHTSRNFWRYQHARATQADTGWQAFRERLHCDLKRVDELLWRPQGTEDVRSTRYLDAVELLDFLRGDPSTVLAERPR